LKPQLSILYFVLSGIIVIACALIFINYGWIAFATFTKRPGLNGNYYYYYRLDRNVFGIYNLLIATGALLTIIRLTWFVYKREQFRVTKTFIYFAIFFSILIMAEIYLNTRFAGKG